VNNIAMNLNNEGQECKTGTCGGEGKWIGQMRVNMVNILYVLVWK
jgi:hypothetical protein